MKSDLTLFGATGFTGRLVLAYLKAHAPKDLHIVLAARNLDKLADVQRELGTTYATTKVDAADSAALLAVAKDTRVVCTTVGPYALHGLPLASACAESGTHYCDLTGEVTFMRRSIDANHSAAEESGAKIVHACGFDSIPSDLGVWMLAEECKRRHGTGLGRTQLFVGPMRGGVSGGTVQSMVQILAEAREDRAVRKLLGSPYALSPDPASDLNLDGRDSIAVRAAPEIDGDIAGPFVMAGCNTRVVRRSNALSGFHYGRQFRYAEEQIFGRGLKGRVIAYTFAAGLGALVASQTNAHTAALLNRLLPKSGDGPTPEAQKNGFFKIRILTESEDGKHRLLGRVAAKGDPGYAATAMMLGESALCLALDSLPKRGGVLTPATAMGATLLSRLRAAGMTFEINDS
jgi:short subunit dehydrogenase-like uncharacterized protein